MANRTRITRAAVAGAVLTSFFLAIAIAVPTAWSQQAGGAAQRAKVVPAKRTLWWNHSDTVMRLKLTADQRTRMDQVYSWHQAPDGEVAPGRLRQNFYDTLKTGDWKAAEQALKAWSEAEAKAAKRQGELKIGVLSLLTPEQLAGFQGRGAANIVRSNWKPKINWPLGGGPQRQPQQRSARQGEQP